MKTLLLKVRRIQIDPKFLAVPRQLVFLPVVAGVSVCSVGILMLVVLGPGPPTPDVTGSSEYIREFPARAFWYGCIVALFIGMGFITAYSHCIIRRNVGVGRRAWLRWTWRGAIYAVAASLVGSLLHAYLIDPGVWKLFDALSTWMDMKAFFHALNASVGLPTAFMIGGVSATLWPLSAHRPLKPHQLRRAMNDLRNLLFLVASILVVATVELFAVHLWVAGSVHSEQAATARMTGITLAGTLGAMYTVFIIAVFAPAAAAHRAYAMRMARRALGKGSSFVEQREWLVSQGLWVSLQSTVARVLVAAGPLVTGGLIPIVLALIPE